MQYCIFLGVTEIFTGVFLIKERLVIGYFYDPNCPQPEGNEFYSWFAEHFRNKTGNKVVAYDLIVDRLGRYNITGYMYKTGYGNIYIRCYSGKIIKVTEVNGTVTSVII